MVSQPVIDFDEANDPPYDGKGLMRFTKPQLIELAAVVKERADGKGEVPQTSLKVMWYFGDGHECPELLKKMFKADIVQVIRAYTEASLKTE